MDLNINEIAAAGAVRRATPVVQVGSTGVPVSASSPLPVVNRGGGYTSTATFLAVAAAIGAGDVMAGAIELTNIGPSGGGDVLITNARLLVEHTAVISGETSYDLHLYNVTPPSALADNAVWDLPAGDRASYLGKISLGVVVDLGSSLFVEQVGVNKQVTVPSGGSLFGYLVTVGAFTPTAANRKVTLKAIGV